MEGTLEITEHTGFQIVSSQVLGFHGNAEGDEEQLSTQGSGDAVPTSGTSRTWPVRRSED